MVAGGGGGRLPGSSRLWFGAVIFPSSGSIVECFTFVENEMSTHSWLFVLIIGGVLNILPYILHCGSGLDGFERPQGYRAIILHYRLCSLVYGITPDNTPDSTGFLEFIETREAYKDPLQTSSFCDGLRRMCHCRGKLFLRC